jgi:TRAP-type C4-dicarboxylate transport system permease small subunit
VDSEPTGWLARAARLATFAGGAMLCAVAAVIVVSVTGRYLFGRPVTGDYELVEMGMAVAIFLCFPYCHMTSTNLVAEFFTTGLGPRAKLALDAFADAAFALVAAVFTWRLAVGLGRKFDQNDTTMLLAIPVWIGYAVAVFSMALLTLVCLARMADEIRRLGR